jgi:hypothetical protein
MERRREIKSEWGKKELMWCCVVCEIFYLSVFISVGWRFDVKLCLLKWNFVLTYTIYIYIAITIIIKKSKHNTYG